MCAPSQTQYTANRAVAEDDGQDDGQDGGRDGVQDGAEDGAQDDAYDDTHDDTHDDAEHGPLFRRAMLFNARCCSTRVAVQNVNTNLRSCWGIQCMATMGLFVINTHRKVFV